MDYDWLCPHASVLYIGMWCSFWLSTTERLLFHVPGGLESDFQDRLLSCLVLTCRWNLKLWKEKNIIPLKLSPALGLTVWRHVVTRKLEFWRSCFFFFKLKILTLKKPVSPLHINETCVSVWLFPLTIHFTNNFYNLLKTLEEDGGILYFVTKMHHTCLFHYNKM